MIRALTILTQKLLQIESNKYWWEVHCDGVQNIKVNIADVTLHQKR